MNDYEKDIEDVHIFSNFFLKIANLLSPPPFFMKSTYMYIAQWGKTDGVMSTIYWASL